MATPGLASLQCLVVPVLNTMQGCYEVRTEADVASSMHMRRLSFATRSHATPPALSTADPAPGADPCDSAFRVTPFAAVCDDDHAISSRPRMQTGAQASAMLSSAKLSRRRG